MCQENRLKIILKAQQFHWLSTCINTNEKWKRARVYVPFCLFFSDPCSLGRQAGWSWQHQINIAVTYFIRTIASISVSVYRRERVHHRTFAKHQQQQQKSDEMGARSRTNKNERKKKKKKKTQTYYAKTVAIVYLSSQHKVTIHLVITIDIADWNRLIIFIRPPCFHATIIRRTSKFIAIRLVIETRAHTKKK